MGNVYPHTIRNFEYNGPLKEPIIGLVSEKRRLGNLYNAPAQILREFDAFTIHEKCPVNNLTREVVQKWNIKRPTNSIKTHYARYHAVKQLGEYMIRLGYPAYIAPNLPDKNFKEAEFIPYIFSNDELKRFFAAVDNTKSDKHSVHQNLSYPLLFRLLYSCGLRLNEALCLKISDVRLNDGVLSIKGTKFDKDRLVPMPKSLTKRFADYLSQVHSFSSADAYVFSSPKGGIYCHSAVYAKYRGYLRRAGISYGGRHYGPRIHDFRHTFAIHCLIKWIKQGKEIDNTLPYLSAYMGHVNTQATHTYLKLTSQLFPEIIQQTENQFPDIIPKLEDRLNEES